MPTKERARPVVKSGVCWSCCSYAPLYLYSDFFQREYRKVCAKCCREFGCKPGHTTDGVKLKPQAK